MAVLRNEKGFTLIEMLVVLTVFMTVLTAAFYITTDKLAAYTNEQIIDQTELLIRLGQVKAIETGDMYEFYAFNCREVILRNSIHRQDVLYRQMLPEEMQIFITTTNSKIVFQSDGNIRNAGSITYHLKDYYYQFSVNLGKGRLITKNVEPLPERTDRC